MRLVGLGLLVGRAFARVLDGQRGGDHHDLGGAAVALALEDHPGQPGVDRELGQPPAQRGEPLRRVGLGRVERAQLVQQVHAVGDVAPVRRVDERERRDVAEPDRRHLEDDRGQVGPQDLRVGELGAGVEVLLVVEADADAVGGTPAAALALVGAGLRDRLDRQPLHLQPAGVAGDPGGARVHHVLDARHGQRGLRDVGGQHHPAVGVRGEDPVLLGGGEPGVQRQDLGAEQRPLLLHQLAQRVGGVPDLPLAAEEHQDVARPLGGQLLDRVADGLDLVPDVLLVGLVLLLGLGDLDQRPVADLHRVGAPGHLDHRRRVALGVGEVLREPVGLDGRRRDDDLEVGPAGQELPEVPEDEVDVEAALVCLVDDQRVVLPQHPVGLQLGQQDAVGHQLDQAVLAHLVGEAHLVADHVAQLGAELVGDPVGDRTGRQPAGLGVPDQPGDPAPQLQADLWELGGLAGAGLTRHDHHLVIADRGGDVVLALTHRQLRRVGDRRHRRATRLQARLRAGHLGPDLGQRRVPPLRVTQPPHAVEPPLEAALVAEHQRGEAAVQVAGGVRGGGYGWLLHVVAKDRQPRGGPPPGYRRRARRHRRAARRG